MHEGLKDISVWTEKNEQALQAPGRYSLTFPSTSLHEFSSRVLYKKTSKNNQELFQDNHIHD